MSINKYSRIQILLILVGIFAVMYALNALMPLHRDDYEYSLIWETSQYIGSFRDVIDSFYRHYMMHGGRVFTLGSLSFFLWIGKDVFNIINASMFVALVVLMYFHARREIKLFGEPVLVAVTSLLAWLSFPHFGEVAVWACGATVYLWSCVVVALFLLPYNISLAKKKNILSGKMTFPMLFLGVLAGWSIENLAVTVVCVTALISWYFYKNKTLYLWMPAGCIGALVGLIGLVVAPGNYVRYDAQGQGKGIFTHIGNQFAGNGEMVLYILPIILALLISWRIFKIVLAEKKGITLKPVDSKVTFGQWILLGLIVLLVVSYFNGSFVAWVIRDALYIGVMVPVGLTDPNVLDKVNNIFRGFEEMAIYWFIIFFIYAMVKKKLGLSKENIKLLAENVKAREIWNSYTSVRYAGKMLALALLNNMVMLAAPTFPARATFSSVAMIIIAAIAMFREPVILENLKKFSGNVIAIGAIAIGAFTISSSLMITYTMRQENDIRIQLVKEAADRGDSIVYMEPIRMTNRALRHVFFVDFDNSVTKYGLCKYYGIEDIKVLKDEKK